MPAGDYKLTNGTLALAGTPIVVINGAGSGASGTQIDGLGASQVLNVGAAVHATINGLTIEHGLTSQSNDGVIGDPAPGVPGGGIANAGTLSLGDVTVTANAAGAGGIYCPSRVFFARDPARRRHILRPPPILPRPICRPPSGASAGSGGSGGGIYNTGTLTITDSTISANTAGAGGNALAGSTAAAPVQAGGNGGNGGSGGGIDNTGTLVISDSTIAANSAGAGGTGGDGSAATVSTASGGNGGAAGAGGAGGGIESSGMLMLSGSTISANTTGAGGNGGSGGLGGGGTGTTPGLNAAGGSGGGRRDRQLGHPDAA